MRKRIFPAALSLLLLFGVLTGCTQKNEGVKSVDLSVFYQSLSETYNFSNHMAVEGDLVASQYPGLENLELKQQVLYAPMMSAVVSEIALVEAANDEDAAAVEEIFQTRIDTQVDGGAWYPETIQGWVDHAQVVRNGNYVMLIANENSDAIVEAFEALFA